MNVVEVEDGVGIGAEITGDNRTEVCHCRSFAPGKGSNGELSVVVTKQAGNLRLTTLVDDLVGIFGEEDAVDTFGTLSERAVVEFVQFFGRELAHVAELIQMVLLGPCCSFLLRLFQANRCGIGDDGTTGAHVAIDEVA